MSVWEALLYGATQGLTEYLPVSSSAHLALLPRFLGTRDPGLAFDVFLHSGTLAATLWYFRRDWIKLVTKDRRTLAWIMVATVPALVAGALLHGWAETVFRDIRITAAMLAVFGLLLWWVDRLRMPKGEVRLSFSRVLRVGLAQCLALVPGVSRSGITLTAARTMGLSRPVAARISFLLSAPVTAAAIGYETLKVIKTNEPLSVEPLALVIGGATAFVFGVLAIDVLVKRVAKLGYGVFALYRLGLAAFLLLLF